MGLKVAPTLAAFLPWGRLRPLVYRLLTRAKVGRGVRIGYGTYLDAKSLTIADGTHVGRLNFLKEIDTLELAEGATIDHYNHVSVLARFSLGRDAKMGSRSTVAGSAWSGEKGSFLVGEGALITGQHHFDCTRTIVIGDRTTVAGVFSSIWTHGYRRESLQDVLIGKGCYLGASIQIASGVTLADHTVVGMGSVVLESLLEANCLIAGVPARVLRRDYNPKHTQDAGH
ncbi:MAG: hypothetical protein V2A58_02030 [Planctomycetota bacterium]